jgi:hypothetical protein
MKKDKKSCLLALHKVNLQIMEKAKKQARIKQCNSFERR